jgi:hypothetical protein
MGLLMVKCGIFGVLYQQKREICVFFRYLGVIFRFFSVGVVVRFEKTSSDGVEIEEFSSESLDVGSYGERESWLGLGEII